MKETLEAGGHAELCLTGFDLRILVYFVIYDSG